MIFRLRKHKPQLTAAAQRRALKHALKNQNKEEAVRIFYQWFDVYGAAPENYTHWRQLLKSTSTPEKMELFNLFMSLIYGPDSADKSLTLLPAKKLARLIGRRSFTRRRLKKNPMSST